MNFPPPHSLSDPEKVASYACQVAMGKGWTNLQEQNHTSTAETEFRLSIKQRKDAILAARRPINHPILYTPANIAQARRNIATTSWGKAWYNELRQRTDHLIAQPAGYLEQMIPALTPTNPYGFTCPACVGRLSQPGAGAYAFSWDYRSPEVIRCKACGQELPDAHFPEDRTLVCPRRNQTFTFYLSPTEIANPDDLTGRHAWPWVSNPAYVSAAGIVRERKVVFMLKSAKDLALMYRLDNNPQYATTAIAILKRFARCVPQWLYHDYFGTFADCDPLYAAWHDTTLPVVWKRNPATINYHSDPNFKRRWLRQHGDDIWPNGAAMASNYFGSGIIHPSTDSLCLKPLIYAYDLLHDATDSNGHPLWHEASRRQVERDLILEWLFISEPFLGGPDKAENTCNKAPRVYMSMALAGKALGFSNFTAVALQGFKNIRDNSFLSDGFSTESPAYGAMFLTDLIHVATALEGLPCQPSPEHPDGTISLFHHDPKYALMLKTLIQVLRPDGRYIPLSDTTVNTSPAAENFEIGLHVLSPVDCAQTAHGPGQQTLSQVGRRVRYINLINKGQNRHSTFVTLHEPSLPDTTWAITSIHRLTTPPAAGPDAIANEITTIWGNYLLLNDFTSPAEIRGTTFHGTFALLFTDLSGKLTILTCAATTCQTNTIGFTAAPHTWQGTITSHTPNTIHTSTPRPHNWPQTPSTVTTYALIGHNHELSGYPIQTLHPNHFTTTDYPIPPSTHFSIPTIQLLTHP